MSTYPSTPDVLGFYAALDVDLPDRPGNVSTRCFLLEHDDRNASASIDTADGRWFCHGCGVGGGAYQAAVAIGREPRDAAELCKSFGLWRGDDEPAASNGKGRLPAPARQPAPLPSAAELRAWHDRLVGDQRVVERLAELRGWSRAGLEQFGLGFDGERIVFPIRDGEGVLVNVERYKPGKRADGERKTLALAGRPRDLFPAPESIEGDEVRLTEGAPDVLAMHELGLPAVGIPGVGFAGSVEKWAPRFTGRRVVISMDDDDAGRKAAKQIAPVLARHAADVRVLSLEALNEERREGYDLTDVLLDARANGGVENARTVLLKAAEGTKPLERDLASSAEGVAPDEAISGPPDRARDGARATAFATIEREQVRWLWPGRIPLGMLTLLIGDPGLGKSLLTCDLASRLTRAVGVALMVTAEDSIGATVRPRLEATEADLSRVFNFVMVRGGEEDGLALPDDIPALNGLVEHHQARLVVIDPLMAHLPEGVNSWRDQSVRGALAPLRRMAEARDCAVLVVAHLNKGQDTNALRRTGGSMGIPAAARSALLLARDPDDPEGEQGNQRVLAHVKTNVSAPAPSLACRVEPVLLPGDERDESARLVLGEEVAITGEDLLKRQDGDERTALADAVAFLLTELEVGSVAARSIQAAARDAGISSRTLERAKGSLGITSSKGGLDGGWKWSLPEGRQGEDRHISGLAAFDSRAKNEPKPPEGRQVAEMAPFGHVEGSGAASAVESGDSEQATPEQEAEVERLQRKFGEAA